MQSDVMERNHLTIDVENEATRDVNLWVSHGSIKFKIDSRLMCIRTAMCSPAGSLAASQMSCQRSSAVLLSLWLFPCVCTLYKKFKM